MSSWTALTWHILPKHVIIHTIKFLKFRTCSLQQKLEFLNFRKNVNIMIKKGILFLMISVQINTFSKKSEMSDQA